MDSFAEEIEQTRLDGDAFSMVIAVFEGLCYGGPYKVLDFIAYFVIDRVAVSRVGDMPSTLWIIHDGLRFFGYSPDRVLAHTMDPIRASRLNIS